MAGLKLAPVLAAPGESGTDHPLLGAVIGTLPAIGAGFNGQQRADWIAMISMAFNVVYGPAGGLMVDATRPLTLTKSDTVTVTIAPPAPKKREPHEAAGCDYYVDSDGYARCDTRRDDSGATIPTPGRRVLVDEAEGQQIYEYRGARRDRATVTWADDAQGALPGMEFCGPG